MSEMKDTILLAGIGLIGGSIALAIKRSIRINGLSVWIFRKNSSLPR